MPVLIYLSRDIRGSTPLNQASAKGIAGVTLGATPTCYYGNSRLSLLYTLYGLIWYSTGTFYSPVPALVCYRFL